MYTVIYKGRKPRRNTTEKGSDKMTTFADAEKALDKAHGALVRLRLGKLEEAHAYRDAAREARAHADEAPNDFKAAERAERLEAAEVEALMAVPVLRRAADIADNLAGERIDAHGAAKVADTLEGHIAEMAAEADRFLAAVRAEGNAKEAAALEGEAAGSILAVQILGKAAQAMRDAAETAKTEADAPAPAEADEAADEAGEVPAWLVAQRAYLEDEAAEFKRYAAACERQGVTVEREHSYREDGLLVGFRYRYTGKGGKAVAWCTARCIGGGRGGGRDNARVDRPNGPAITFKYPQRAKAKALAIAAGREA